MIKVNGFDYEWKAKMTVAGLMKKLQDDSRFSYLAKPAVTVIINGTIIPMAEYERCTINHGDEIKLQYIILGG